MVHKAVLYAVLTFVIVGAAISLAGPGGTTAITTETQTEEQSIPLAQSELLAKDIDVSNSGT